jgi:hypothetical protein
MSLPSSEGPDIRRTVGVGHPRVVIGDAAHSSRSASFVEDVTKLFLVSIPIAEQTLIDMQAVTRGVPASFASLTSLIVLFRPVLPPVHKVVEAGVEHGPWDVQGHRGIVEDAWLEAVEGVGASKGL